MDSGKVPVDRVALPNLKIPLPIRGKPSKGRLRLEFGPVRGPDLLVFVRDPQLFKNEADRFGTRADVEVDDRGFGHGDRPHSSPAPNDPTVQRLRAAPSAGSAG